MIQAFLPASLFEMFQRANVTLLAALTLFATDFARARSDYTSGAPASIQDRRPASLRAIFSKAPAIVTMASP